MKRNEQAGIISIYVLLLGVVFSVMSGGLVTFGILEFISSRRAEASNQALAIAEAGINYYKWHLAHEPEDFQDGTGDVGPYIHEFYDPQGDIVGQFSLDITPPPDGSYIAQIRSTGWTNTYPNLKRTIKVRYGPEPITRFSFLHNASVWFGQGLTVYGEVYSNGGIRFDGVNESVVRSAKEDYQCGSETGCSPTQSRPGVWGSGGPSELWEFPVPAFDFDGVVTDFSQMKEAAQSSGVYLNSSGAWGYHVVLNSDASLSVYRVTNAANLRGWSVENGCENLYQRIDGQALVGTYSTADNQIVYVEDTVWVDGVVDGNVTIVAAKLPVGSNSTDMWINGNITYEEMNGGDSLGLVAQRNIYYARNLPENFVINGAMMAQSGRIMRHYYRNWWCGYSNEAVKDSLTIFGSVISNQKSYWNYSNYWGLLSGFETREITFNQQTVVEPPPYFPTTSTAKLLSWEEE